MRFILLSSNQYLSWVAWKGWTSFPGVNLPFSLSVQPHPSLPTHSLLTFLPVWLMTPALMHCCHGYVYRGMPRCLLSCHGNPSPPPSFQQQSCQVLGNPLCELWPRWGQAWWDCLPCQDQPISLALFWLLEIWNQLRNCGPACDF